MSTAPEGRHLGVGDKDGCLSCRHACDRDVLQVPLDGPAELHVELPHAPDKGGILERELVREIWPEIEGPLRRMDARGHVSFPHHLDRDCRRAPLVFDARSDGHLVPVRGGVRWIQEKEGYSTKTGANGAEENDRYSQGQACKSPFGRTILWDDPDRGQREVEWSFHQNRGSRVGPFPFQSDLPARPRSDHAQVEPSDAGNKDITAAVGEGEDDLDDLPREDLALREGGDLDMSPLSWTVGALQRCGCIY